MKSEEFTIFSVIFTEFATGCAKIMTKRFNAFLSKCYYAITPFIDIRYGGGVGWTQDIEDPLRPGVTYDRTGFYHSVLLNFGYRIF